MAAHLIAGLKMLKYADNAKEMIPTKYEMEYARSATQRLPIRL